MKKQPSRRITRREFLIGAGAALAGAALACGRERPTATAVPALTPVSTHTPAPIIPTAPPERATDLVLMNGKIITVDPADTIAQAVAVKDGLIQAVGSDGDVAPLIGEATRVVDLGGRAVTPGLIDAHNHLQILGLLQGFYVPLMPPEVRSIEDMQARLAEAVAQTPEGEWIMGYFLALGRLPNRHDLDPVAPNHPVWLMQQGGHYGSANSLALQVAGITAATPNPTGGVIERDANGEPTGVFYNHRAMDLLRRYIPRYTPEDVRNNIAYAQPIFAAAGVTTFHDNNVRGTDTVAAYFDTDREGKMLIRGQVYYTLEWPRDLDRALQEVEYYEGNGLMRFAGFKFLLDGQAHMAYCHEPHNGVRWDMPTWDPQTFKEAVRALHDTGLQICIHCVGDAAVDLTLDAYEEAMNANPRPDPRHRIEHCVLCTPEATQRMKDLGVVVSTQPQFIRLGGDVWPTIFGEERMSRVIVTREWLEEGVVVALGSDAPTTPWLTPQVTLFGAVRRATYSKEQVGPEQCLTVQEALRAHTMGSAYAGFEEDVKGSIEVGKLADLVVWSEDPYTASLKRLWQIPVEMTLVGGEIVHQGGDTSLLPRRAGDL
ncbi:MAG TPA: amidohydrolase [Thermoflexia bacterium]|nr:amidohydrolase [Thermoflexia bacterium]